MDNYFQTLNNINVNGKTEKKGKLTYLSWAWAWGEVKKLYPDTTYTIYEAENGCNYFTDGRTCWVKTGVTVGGIEHIEYLPVMDYNNKSILLEEVTSFDVNKAIQRSLTKALARHGLGLYLYAGEDLPEGEKQGAGPLEKISPIHLDAVRAELRRTGWNEESMLDYLGKKYHCEIKRIEDMTMEQSVYLLKSLEKKPDKAAKNAQM